MVKQYVVEQLDKQKHDRAAFSCGVTALDAYVKDRATQDVKRKIAVTYILTRPDSSSIIGYYTISTTSIETTQLSETVTRRLPRYETLPAMLIGRLAVDEQYRGQGFGELLLMDALSRCFKLSLEIGAMAVVVDAKDEGAARFYERYGFRRFEDLPLKLYMPMAEIESLVQRGEQDLLP
jgi:GNAT superfamily N-acetyltransferase